MAFLYRHALELSLKHIIHHCARLAAFRFREDVETSFKHNHDFKKLSKIAQTILLKFFPTDIDLHKALDFVVETCAELSEIDGKSNLFRYPEGKEDDPLSIKWQRINLLSYASRMSLVLDSLNSIQFGLNIEIDLAQNVYEKVQELIAQESQDEYRQ